MAEKLDVRQYRARRASTYQAKAGITERILTVFRRSKDGPRYVRVGQGKKVYPLSSDGVRDGELWFGDLSPQRWEVLEEITTDEV